MHQQETRGRGRDMAFTMVAGEFVYRDGQYLTVDLEEILGFVQEKTAPRVKPLDLDVALVTGKSPASTEAG